MLENTQEFDTYIVAASVKFRNTPSIFENIRYSIRIDAFPYITGLGSKFRTDILIMIIVSLMLFFSQFFPMLRTINMLSSLFCVFCFLYIVSSLLGQKTFPIMRHCANLNPCDVPDLPLKFVPIILGHPVYIFIIIS